MNWAERILSVIPRTISTTITSFSESLRNNMGTGLLALSLSVALWVFVTSEQNPPLEDTLGSFIPVQPVNVPVDLDILGAIEDVTIRLSAPIDMWEDLSPKDFEALVDLNGFGPGEHLAAVRVSSKDSRVKILEAIPSKIRVQMEAVKKREVPVQINSVGLPLKGYSAGEPEWSPKSVEVRGPESLVDLVEVAVADVDMSERLTDFRGFRGLKLRTIGGYEVTEVRMEPTSVMVEVPITRNVQLLSLPVLPEVLGSPAQGYQITSITLEPPLVAVIGNASDLRDLTYIATLPIDLSEATDSVDRFVPLDLPESLNLQPPVQIRVKIGIVKIQGTALFLVAPIIEGLATNRTVAIGTNYVELLLEGDAAKLKELSPRQISVTLDLQGLAIGGHSLRPVVTLPEDVTNVAVANISPETISVNIE